MHSRSLVVLVPLLVAWLSGCASNQGRPVEPPIGGESEAPFLTLPTFTPEIYVPESGGFAEPSIEVAPDGTIYVSAPGDRTVTGADTPVRGDRVWRSDDGGKTFARLPSPDPGTGGGDSDLAVAPDGTVFHSGLAAYAPIGGQCVSLAMSKDKGQTWKNDPFACGYTAVVDDRNWIANHGTDTVYVTFGWNPAPLEATGQVVLLRADMTQDPPGKTQTQFNDNFQWPGPVEVDPRNGNVYIAYTTTDEKVVVLTSTDRGASLQRHVVAQRTGDLFDSFAGLAVDEAGTVYVAWSERDAPEDQKTNRTDIYYAFSTDAAKTWSEPRRVNSFVGSHIFPWIDSDQAGRLVVVWYGTPTTGDTAERIKGAVWNVYLADSKNADRRDASFVEAEVSQQPITKGSICTSGTGCGPGTRDLLDFFQVSLDKAGLPHVAWATKTGGQGVKLAYAKQLIESSASAPT